MELKTRAYGLVEINPEDIITFENGIIGFEEKRKFVLLGQPETNDILVWLQSADDADLAFVVIQPKFFWPAYNPAVTMDEVEDLNVEDASELLAYAIVVVPEDIKKMTANLKAPIIINVKNNKAKQIVLRDDSYKIKEAIFGEK